VQMRIAGGMNAGPASVRDANRGRHECRPYGPRTFPCARDDTIIPPVVPGAAGIHAPNTRARTATTGPPSRPVGAGPGTRRNRVAIAPGTIQTNPFR